MKYNDIHLTMFASSLTINYMKLVIDDSQMTCNVSGHINGTVMRGIFSSSLFHRDTEDTLCLIRQDSGQGDMSLLCDYSVTVCGFPGIRDQKHSPPQKKKPLHNKMEIFCCSRNDRKTI